MHSLTIWKLARSPNYLTNVDKKFPYSECPYLGGYKLIKLPTTDDLIELVDYWGEGLISTELGASGFANSYNVNHEYQLVSNGNDRNKKIPNRVPVLSYTNCSTSAYIKDNSVKHVTLMGAPINKSCAADIARMVIKDNGKVIVYGFDENDTDVKNLEDALSKIGIISCIGYDLPELFKGPTLFQSTRAYLNINDIKKELSDSIKFGKYDKAVSISKTLENEGVGDTLLEIINHLLENGNKNLMSYAFKLRESADNIFNRYLPVAVKVIFNGSEVKILNKGKLTPLILEENNGSRRLVLADSANNNNDTLRWKLIPYWDDTEVCFKIPNISTNTVLATDIIHDPNGVKITSGVSGDSSRWILEPRKLDDDLFFYIINKETKQYIQVGKDANTSNIVLWSYNSALADKANDLGWFMAPYELSD